jgi:hypothetical protein
MNPMQFLKGLDRTEMALLTIVFTKHFLSVDYSLGFKSAKIREHQVKIIYSL